MLALLLLACAPAPVDTADAAPAPTDYPDTIVYVPAGAARVLEVHSWTYAASCDNPGALVTRVGGLLCSVTGDGQVLDSDGDGLCELSPPVDLAVSLWR